MEEASRRARQLQVLIPLDRNEQVGTDEYPYRLSDSTAKRRRAIEAGLERRIRAARTQLKRRLNVLRIYRKNNPTCDVIENDMRWFDTKHYTGGTTRNVCATATRCAPASTTRGTSARR